MDKIFLEKLQPFIFLNTFKISIADIIFGNIKERRNISCNQGRKNMFSFFRYLSKKIFPRRKNKKKTPYHVDPVVLKTVKFNIRRTGLTGTPLMPR